MTTGHAINEGLAEQLAGAGLDNQPNEVTMRGDLQQMSVSDIFQTLAMSKMEGMLRIRNPLEQHLLFFKDGCVQDLIPHRIETRRLGERLIRAGMLEPEQLREVLQVQKQTGIPLGALLVREGLVTQEQVEEVAYYQAAEDLYSLFTWSDGSFEFFKGPCADPEYLELLDVLPRFQGNLILLEVARRQDEWEPILDTLHSVDEIIVPIRDRSDEKTQDNHLLILDALDGHRTIRELAETTLLSLFDCARAVRDLHRWGLVGLATAEEALDTARSHVDHGHLKRAIAVLRALVQREEPAEPDAVRESAALLHRCGETGMAGQALLDAARAQADPDIATELVREAHKMDPRSVEALSLLLEQLLISGEENAELHEVSCTLADALAEQGQAAEALEVIAILETSAPDSSSAIVRKARILHKLGRGEEAIEELLRLAQVHKDEDRPDRLAIVYEQILKIDYRRKDISKALKGLRASKFRKRTQVLGIVGAVVIAASAAYWIYQIELAAERNTRFIDAVNARLGDKDTAGAMAMVTLAENDLDDETIGNMRARVQAAIEENRARILRQQLDARRARMAQAADHVEHGQLQAALLIYEDLLKDPAAQKEVTTVVRTRLGGMTRLLYNLSGELETLIPEPPDPLLQPESERREVLKMLREKFRSAPLLMARGVLQIRGSKVLESLIGFQQRDRLVVSAESVAGLYKQAEARRKQYLALQSRTETEKRLQPTFTAAEEYAEKHDFRRARAAYQKLASEYPDENDFKAHFREQAARYDTILKAMQVLADATKSGDYTTARGQLRYLKLSEPEVPFESLVELPLRITTIPEGATIFLNGRRAGKSPLLSSYRPTGTQRVQVRAEGFDSEEITFKGHAKGEVNFVLAKTPDWTFKTKGSIERAPAIDAQGRAFVVDRSGQVTAIQTRNGEPLWSHQTKDLSGLLPTPVIWGSDVILFTLDGRVSALNRKSAEQHWRRFGIPCEAGAVIAGDVLVAATTGGKLFGLDPNSGEDRFSLTLPGPVRADIATRGTRAYVATTNGWIVCVDAEQGRVRWKQRVADTMVAGPCLTPTSVIAASDTGRLMSLQLDTGKRLWFLSGLGELLLTPAATATRVVVAEEERLRSFDIANGNAGPSFTGRNIWSSMPVALDGNIIVGDRAGMVVVLSADELALKFRVAGDKRALAPATVDRDERVIVGFEGGVLHGFRRLR